MTPRHFLNLVERVVNHGKLLGMYNFIHLCDVRVVFIAILIPLSFFVIAPFAAVHVVPFCRTKRLVSIRTDRPTLSQMASPYGAAQEGAEIEVSAESQARRERSSRQHVWLLLEPPLATCFNAKHIANGVRSWSSSRRSRDGAFY